LCKNRQEQFNKKALTEGFEFSMFMYTLNECVLIPIRWTAKWRKERSNF